MQGKLYTYDDLGNMHVPSRAFYARCLAEGHSPIWWPNVWCGYYLHGEGQVGMCHPLHYALYKWLPFTAAFNIEFFLPYPLLLAGTFFFLRRWRLGRAASMFGAIAFTFSSFNMLHFMHLHCVSIIAHMPWLLLAIDVFLRNAGARAAAAGVAIVLLTASQLLLGHAQFVWFSALAEGLYVILLFPCWKSRWKILTVGISKLLGILVAGVQLLPTYETYLASDRLTSSLFRTIGLSLPPANLWQLVGPYLFKDRIVADEFTANTQEYGIYAGAIALVMFVWIAANIRRAGERKRLAVGAMILTALGVLLSFGYYSGAFIARLPVIGWFRAPCRHIVLVNLGIAVAAAVCFEVLAASSSENRKMPWRGFWAMAILVLASLAGVALVGLPGVSAGRVAVLSSYAAGSGISIVLGPTLVALAVVLFVAAARASRIALAGIIIFAAADLGVYGVSFIRTKPAQTLESLRDIVRLPPGRIFADPTADNIPALSGHSLVKGYVGLAPARVLDYGRTPALRLASAAWLVIKPDEGAGTVGNPLLNMVLAPVPDPMPRALLVPNAIVTADPNSLLSSIDIATTALVGEDLGLGGGPAGTAVITSDLPGVIRLTVDAPSRQLLVVSESYHGGWRASVDGAAAGVVRAYGDFLGVAVDPGHHSVELAFRPESLKRGMQVSLAGLALTLVFALFEFSRKGRPASG